MKQHLLKRILSVILVAALLAGYYVPATEAASTDIVWKESDRKGTLEPAGQKADSAEEEKYKPEDMVRVSIVLEDKPTVQAGFSTMNIAGNGQAMAYKQQLRQKQDALAQSISNQVLGGQQLDVVWNLTLVGNLISANVPYGKLDAIAGVKGVKGVFLETSYAPCVVERDGTEVDPQMFTASGMVGSTQVWSNGYTGAGSRIAVIDTGIDTKHQSLSEGAYWYAMRQNAEAAGLDVEQYYASMNVLGEEEIRSVLSELNIADRIHGLRASDLFLTDKLPFAANYVDKNLVVDHRQDRQGEHGSHVAGIAAANRYIPQSGGYVKALESVKMAGIAPDAQLIIMKVFGKADGPYDSDYMSAIEDAILLNCDAVNLSLGSSNAGDGMHPYYASLLDYMTTTDTVVVASCGNSYDWATATTYGYLYSDDVNMDTVGSPGSYSSFFTVASVENSGGVGNGMEVEGNTFRYSDAGLQGFCDPLTTLDSSPDGSGTEYEYVLINGIGNPEDYAGIDLTGKIVFCARGKLSFLEKANYAVSLGAAAVVIYNNDSSGLVNMDLTGYGYRTPCVAISQADARTIINLSIRNTSVAGVQYLEGTVTVRDKKTYLMSDFSSWGVPGDLSLKPEITAPGGEIYSLWGENNVTIGGNTRYEMMSGTSMAAPAVAGMTALLAQYIREKGLTEQTGLSVRQLAQSLLMSTAVPIREEDSGGNYYSLLKQGSGLARVDLAAGASSYILVDGQNDGKVKAELGDDPNRTGVYEFSFTIHNLSGKAESYILSADVFRQDVFENFQQAGVYMLDTWTADLPAVASFTVNGKAVRDMSDYDRDGGMVTVPAGGSVSVDVKLTLTADGKAMLEESYENGTYVEAFVFAEAVSGEEGESGTVHSIPVLAFYGNWSDPSMYDRGTAVENYYNDSPVTPYLYAVNGFYGNGVTIDYGDGQEYYFGGNPYLNDTEYLPERNALNSTDASFLKNQYATLIRKAAEARIRIANADTGEIYYEYVEDQPGYAFYYVYAGAWYDTENQFPVNWNGRDAQGNPLPEDTHVEVTLTAATEYYRKADGTYAYEDLGEGACLKTCFTIDNTAPQVKNVELAGNALRVTARDNQYVAAVVLVSSPGSTTIAAQSPNQTRQNTDISVDLDLSSAFGEEFVVEVYDYAGNCSTWEVSLTDDECTDHSYVPVVTEATCSSQGYTTYTCAQCGDSYVGDYTGPVDHKYESGKCKWCDKEEYVVQWKAGSTSLNGTVDLTVSVVLSDNLVRDPSTVVRFRYADKTVDVPMAKAKEEWVNGVLRYRFSISMYAKQMTEKVTFQVYTDKGPVGKSRSYSIEEYCVNMLGKNPTPDSRRMYVALLNYGAAAQQRFNYNTANLANRSLSEADKKLSENIDVSAYKLSLTGSEPGIRAKSGSLILEDVVIIRVIYELEAGRKISDYTFTIDGKKVQPRHMEGNLWCVETEGIPAKDMDDIHTFTCGGITAKYGALSYVLSKLNSPDPLNVQIVKALYDYWYAAKVLLG